MDVSKRLKLYQECLLVAALRRIYPEKASMIYWNRAIGDYFIEPDVTFGASPEAPEVILCVAHSKSVKDSDKKFWRNAAELALSKARLDTMPMVVNVIFESDYKPELIEIMARMFDEQVRLVEDLSAGTLVNSGPDLVTGPLRGKSPQAALEYVEEVFLAKTDANSELEKLADWLRRTIESGNKRHNSYWNSLRQHSPSQEEIASLEFKSDGALRRGASKLLCFAEANRSSMLELAASGSLGEIEEFAFGLGWAQRTLRSGVGRIIDPDIVSLARTFDAEAVRQMLKNLPENVLTGINRVAVEPCRRSGAEGTSLLTYYENHHEKFRTPAGLMALLEQCYRDPTMGGEVDVGRCWMIDFCLAAGKAVEGRPQGYGLSQLASELKVAQQDRVNFWVKDYSSRHKMFPSHVLQAISATLSSRFELLTNRYTKTSDQGAAILRFMHHTLVEVKLCTYRLFRPAEELFRQACLASGLQADPATLRTADIFVGQRGGVGTHGLVVQKGDWKCFVKVQSGAKNTHDKAKELCGRIGFSLKKAGTSYQPQFEETLLVLDGPYTRSEARMCRAAGWHNVVALDQIDQAFISTLGNP